MNRKQIIAGGMGATLALAGAGAGLALAQGASTPQTDAAAVAAAEGAQASALTKADASQGTFAYDQATITPNSVIASTFRGATNALCQATDDFAQVNPLEWKISVSGDVNDAFTADVGELSGEDSVQQVMTCTCGGNPADGRAIITADVKGIPVSYLLDRAQARAGVNTLTFVASDGTEVSMPLAYVIAHHGVISYEINDEDLSASVGGNNQLWLTGTSANYFVRDIVEVRVTSEEVLPPEPGEGMDYPNSPNVGLLSAEVSE